MKVKSVMLEMNSFSMLKCMLKCFFEICNLGEESSEELDRR